MSNIALFSSASAILADLKAGLPGYLADDATRSELSHYNDEVQSGPNYPSLSIKGKVFTLHKDGESTRLMRDEDEVLQNIQVTVLRANPNARVFYAKKYAEGDEGDAARPDCYTNNGKVPAADAKDPQSHKCIVCPHAVWGTGQEGVGTACKVNTRLAIVAPEMLAAGKAEPTLLRLPAGSRSNFADLVKATKRHGSPYFAAVTKAKTASATRTAADDADEDGVIEMPVKPTKAKAKPIVEDDDEVIDLPVKPTKAKAKPIVEDDDADEVEVPAAKPEKTAAKAAPAKSAKVSKAADDVLSGLDDLLNMPDD